MCHSQRVSTELLVLLLLLVLLVLLLLVLVVLVMLLVLLVGTVQPPQVGLAVEGGADLERRAGRRHAAQGQSSLVGGHAGPWRRPSGGQGLELGVHLGVRGGQVWAEAGA